MRFMSGSKLHHLIASEKISLIFSYIEHCSGILWQVLVDEMDRRLLSIMYTIRWAVNKTNPIQPKNVIKMNILSLFSGTFWAKEMFDETIDFILSSESDSFHGLISWTVVVPFQVST